MISETLIGFLLSAHNTAQKTLNRGVEQDVCNNNKNKKLHH